MDYNRDIMTHQEEILFLHKIIMTQKKEINILKSANSSMAKENIKLREKINQK